MDFKTESGKKKKSVKGACWGGPGWLSQKSMEILISGIWVRAPHWVEGLLKKINF